MNRIGPGATGEDSSAHTRQTFLYFGSLTLFLYLATPIGYLIDIPRDIHQFLIRCVTKNGCNKREDRDSFILLGSMHLLTVK